MSDQKLKFIQQEIISSFQLGQVVKVTYVPSGVTNLSLGMTGIVERTPQKEGFQLFVPVKFSDGKIITCNVDCLDLTFSPVKSEILTGEPADFRLENC